jgi:hypothetical protein
MKTTLVQLLFGSTTSAACERWRVPHVCWFCDVLLFALLQRRKMQIDEDYLYEKFLSQGNQ